MIIWLGNEEYEVKELITQTEFDIVSVEAIIEKLMQEKCVTSAHTAPSSPVC